MTRKTFKLGQPIRVQVASTDRLLRTVDFILPRTGTGARVRKLPCKAVSHTCNHDWKERETPWEGKY